MPFQKKDESSTSTTHDTSSGPTESSLALEESTLSPSEPASEVHTPPKATMWAQQYGAYYAQPQQSALQQVITYTDHQLRFTSTNALPTSSNIDTSSSLLTDNPRFPRLFRSSNKVLIDILEPRLDGYCEAVDEDLWSLQRFTELLNGARQPARTRALRVQDGEAALSHYLDLAYMQAINDCINPAETPAAEAFNPDGGCQWSPVGLGRPLQTDWLLAYHRHEDIENRAIIEVKTPSTAALVVFQAIDTVMANDWVQVGDDGFVSLDEAVQQVFDWGTRERVRRILTQIWCQMIHYEVRIALLTTHCNTKVFYVDDGVIQVSRTIYQNGATVEDPCDSLFPLFLAVGLLDEEDTVLPRQYIGDPTPSPEVQEYHQGQVMPMGGAYLQYPGGYFQPPGQVYYAPAYYNGHQYQLPLDSPFYFSSMKCNDARSSARAQPEPSRNSLHQREQETEDTIRRPKLEVDIAAKETDHDVSELEGLRSLTLGSPTGSVESSNTKQSSEKAHDSSVREETVSKSALDVQVSSVIPVASEDVAIPVERLGPSSLFVRLGTTFTFKRRLAQDVAHSLGKVRKWTDVLYGPVDRQALVDGRLPLVESGPTNDASEATAAHAPQTIILEELLSYGLIWDCFSISAVPSFKEFPLVAKVITLEAFEKTPDPKICYGPYSRDGLSRDRARHAIANEFMALSYINDVQSDIVPRILGLWGGVQLGKQVWVLVMEKVGEQVDSAVLPMAEKEQILNAYERLHEAGVLHGDVAVRHWRRSLKRNEDRASDQSGGRIKIIDFDRAMSRAACKPEHWEMLRAKEMAKVRRELHLKM